MLSSASFLFSSFSLFFISHFLFLFRMSGLVTYTAFTACAWTIVERGGSWYTYPACSFLQMTKVDDSLMKILHTYGSSQTFLDLVLNSVMTLRKLFKGDCRLAIKTPLLLAIMIPCYSMALVLPRPQKTLGALRWQSASINLTSACCPVDSFHYQGLCSSASFSASQRYYNRS